MANQIPHIESAAEVILRYSTGEEPMLVLGTDGLRYVCKYSTFAGSANKLACEYVGLQLAQTWGLYVPQPVILRLHKDHLMGQRMRELSDKVCIGTQFKDDAIDITEISLLSVGTSEEQMMELIDIALFDMWVANEDRNINNYNLMFGINDEHFVAIDFGCIFNTSTIEFPLSQLTYTDSLLYSDLFRYILRTNPAYLTEERLQTIAKSYKEKVKACAQIRNGLLDDMPSEWQIHKETIESKLNELFTEEWITKTWDNFLSILEDVTHGTN